VGTGLGNYTIGYVNGALTVLKATPVITFGTAPTPTEGSNFSVSATTTNTDSAALTYSQVSGPCALVSGATFSSSDSGTCVVKASGAETGNFFAASATQSVAIANVAPVVTSFIIYQDSGYAIPLNGTPLAIGSTVYAKALFSDPGTADTHTCVFSWDDGTTSGPLAAVVGSCTASHTYNGTAPNGGAGVYTVTVQVTDDDLGVSDADTTTAGNQPTLYEFVVIYDPKGGFVTGGGWIMSPAGAYIANLTLTGKATFGFVSKYLPGKTVPSGNTEFQFHVAKFNFSSTNYQWLVVAGARAQYKGTGTVNGAGNYGFLLTATDGQVSGGGGVDKFRIKIWDKNAGDAVVYDNAAGPDDIDTSPQQGIAGGSIVIHTKP
jgi:hypothetical protein